MSVEVVGAYSLTEIAAFLESIGTYPTLEQAYQAVIRDPQFFHDFAIREGMQGPAAVIRKVVGGAPPAVTSPTLTPLEMAGDYNLLATPQEVKTGVIGFKEIPGAGGNPPSYGPTTLLGVDLGIVGAVAAPLLGVALGVNMYETNPELWTKISQKLLPFCYPDSTIVPTWAEIADGIWQASIPKALIDALKDLFDEEGIGPADKYDVDPSKLEHPTSYTLPLQTISEGEWVASQSGRQYHWKFSMTTGIAVVIANATQYALYYFSNVAGEVGRYWDWYTGQTPPSAGYSLTANGSVTTHDGQRVYYGSHATYKTQYISGPVGSPVLNPWSVKDLATILFDGAPVGNYPPGTSPWTGTLYDPIPSAPPLVIGDDPVSGTPVTQPMIPVTLPIPAPKVTPGQPQPSPDPEEQPDPTITDPDEQIEPYIMPLPMPDEETDPTIAPEPDPEEDPSRPVEDPPQKIVDIIPLPPPPSGISPWPSLPTTPSWFDTDVGMVTVYHPTPAQFYAFCRWLWVTLSQATIETVWNNPFDGVITAYELYCTPTDNGHRNIHSGFLDSGINSATISRYTEINCGTVGIPEYYGTYFDYSPYSKAHVYLPFIGIQELNVDDIVGHAVNITYRIDEYNGACIAMITVAKVTEVNGEEVEYSNTMYQFSGNCSVELPMAGGSQAQIKAGLMMADATRQAALIGAGADLLGGLGSLLNLNLGGLLGGLGSAAYTLAQGEVSALGHMLSGKSTVQKSGSFGTSHGALGIKTPFIVVTRPKQIAVANYNELYGYPAHKMVTVGACTGFIRCREIHVYSPTATDEEKSMIEALFKSGVYVTE